MYCLVSKKIGILNGDFLLKHELDLKLENFNTFLFELDLKKTPFAHYFFRVMHVQREVQGFYD